jgi:probable F420-dependent oxidoreductase
MTAPAIEHVTGVGIWSRELRYNTDRAACREAVRELEQLGYRTVWIPDVGGDPLGVAGELLEVTEQLAVATGILNVWMHDPASVARQYRQTLDQFGNRFVLGLGNSHAPLVDAGSPGRYQRPVTRLLGFLDGLQSAGLDTKEETVLAALGPRMQGIVRDRAAGSHPYLVTTEYLRRSRELIGPGKLLAPALSVVLVADRARARAQARAHLTGYLTLPNYLNNFRRMGFDNEELRDGGSDRFVDDLVAWGDVAKIGQRVAEFFDAGADHVCLQVADVPSEQLPMTEWQTLAALTGSRGR